MVLGAVGKLRLEMEVYAAVESPHGWGSATTLTSPVNVCVIRMGVGLIGDSKTGFDVVFCVFEHVTLDGCHFGRDAMTQADDGGKVYNNLVVAGVSPVNACVIRMGVGLIGDSKTGFDVVFCVFEHVTLDGCHFGRDAMTHPDDGGKVYNNLVVAGVSIVAEFEMC
jgi:hypothetical protein